MSSELSPLIEMLRDRADVDVVWLYGSVARGEAGARSDVDLAVAFHAPSQEPWERVDALRAALQARAERCVSVLDLNRAPTPLAYEVIRGGRVLVCRDDLRLRAEERRVWSLWESYRQAHEPRRTAS